MPKAERVEGIGSVVLVGAGKGGVGKSTVAVNLAIGLSRLGTSVGILDADVHGPSLPMMLGAMKERPKTEENRIEPIRAHGLACMSMGFLVDPDQAMIWRGPMLAQALMQLVRDVSWGKLDYLVVDLPPGTGDVPLSISQSIPGSMAVLVTTPQDVALADVRRARVMLEKVEIPVLGVIENMSHLVCPHCERDVDVFNRGGGERAASEMGLRFFGAIPLDPVIRESGDEGIPHIVQAPDGDRARSIVEIASRVSEEVSKRQRESRGFVKPQLKVVQ